jgi:cytochrome c553
VSWPGQDKAALGYIDTHDLLQRGKACAACHVGDGTKEVNHDLVAAGHPRLQFEYSAYLAMEVKHWDVAAEKRRFPDLEVRTWALGQLLSAQAALELLATRAQDDSTTRTSTEPRPWPELAEYDCFACHHDLKSQSWRASQRLLAEQQAGVGVQRKQPGMLDWGSWYTAQLSKSLAASRSSQREQIEKTLRTLHELMGTSQNRQEVAAAARHAASMLGKAAEMLASEKRDPQALDNLIDVLLHPNDNRAELTWDRATQMYLGLAAAVNARNDLQPNRKNPRFEQRVRAIATLLRFPGGPKDAFQFDSPSDFDPKKVRQAVQELESGNPK